MFAIEVEKKEKDEEFSFEDVMRKMIKKISHEDCGSERVGTELKREGAYTSDAVPGDYYYFLECKRCGAKRKIIFREKDRIATVRLVFEGGKTIIENELCITTTRSEK